MELNIRDKVCSVFSLKIQCINESDNKFIWNQNQLVYCYIKNIVHNQKLPLVTKPITIRLPFQKNCVIIPKIFICSLDIYGTGIICQIVPYCRSYFFRREKRNHVKRCVWQFGECKRWLLTYIKFTIIHINLNACNMND